MERCLAYGVLPEEEAEKVYKVVLKRKGLKKSTSGTTPPPTSTASKSSTKKKKVKKILDDVEYDAGMGAGGDEGIGITGL
ncbi:hypothetical protein ACHAWX_000038 [Stephanocyclus meneghinianus]